MFEAYLHQPKKIPTEKLSWEINSTPYNLGKMQCVVSSKVCSTCSMGKS